MSDSPISGQQLSVMFDRCCRFGCDAIPVVAPLVRLWPRGYQGREPETAIEIRIPMGFCARHRDGVYARDLFGDDISWARLVASVEQRGKQTPDRSTARIEWWSVDKMRAWFADRLAQRRARVKLDDVGDLRSIGGPGGDVVDVDPQPGGEQPDH